MVLGEMNVTRAKPKTLATRGASLQPAAVAYCPAGSQRPPLSRWTTSTRPGARRALGDGMTCGEDKRRDRLCTSLNSFRMDIQKY